MPDKHHCTRQVFVVPALAFTRWGLAWACWPVTHVLDSWSDWIEHADDMYDFYDDSPPEGYGRLFIKTA